MSLTADSGPATAAAPSRMSSETTTAAKRIVSFDAYRGFVMLLMASDGLNFSDVARNFPNSHFWQFLAYQTEHTPWRGCSLWDLIQPSFSFLVGVSLPYSIAKRRSTGQTFPSMFGHAVWRAILLTFLGVFLRSMHRPQTYFTFEDTLSQIGMGYVFLFLLGFASKKIQWGALAFILVGYWAAFALYPLPPAGFDYQSVGVPPDWHHLTGFAAHWDKNTNLAAAFDQWFLNLFPRESHFVFNDGGYLTLSFIPTLGTMILGLLTGQYLREPGLPGNKVKTMATLGVAGLIVGTLFDVTGICPSVKRIWTPSWVLFSGGWALILLSCFYAIIDLKGWKRWAFPLIVVGMNSIAMYCMDHLWYDWLKNLFPIFLGPNIYNIFGAAFAPATQMLMMLTFLWLCCYWLYRRKIFLKV